MNPLDEVRNTINPTATETEVPSYGLFGNFIASSLGKTLGRRGIFDQAKQNTQNTFGAAPKVFNGGGMSNWFKSKIMDNVLGIPKSNAIAPDTSGFGSGTGIGGFAKKLMDNIPAPQPEPQPEPQPAPAPAPAPEPQPASIAPVPAPAPQKSYRDFQWDDYNADRQTMDVDERDQYYDNYQRDRDFWGNFYNQQPSMPKPMDTYEPMSPYRQHRMDRMDQRMEQDRMSQNRMGQGFGGGGLRSLLGALGNLFGGGFGGGGYSPRPRMGLGGLFRPQPYQDNRDKAFMRDNMEQNRLLPVERDYEADRDLSSFAVMPDDYGEVDVMPAPEPAPAPIPRPSRFGGLSSLFSRMF